MILEILPVLKNWNSDVVGFFLVIHEDDDCKCKNGGVCTGIEDSGMSCACPDGYTGILCEKGMLFAFRKSSVQTIFSPQTRREVAISVAEGMVCVIIQFSITYLPVYGATQFKI